MRFTTALDERSEFRKSLHLSQIRVVSCDKAVVLTSCFVLCTLFLFLKTLRLTFYSIERKADTRPTVGLPITVDEVLRTKYKIQSSKHTSQHAKGP